MTLKKFTQQHCEALKKVYFCSPQLYSAVWTGRSIEMYQNSRNAAECTHPQSLADMPSVSSSLRAYQGAHLFYSVNTDYRLF